MPSVILPPTTLFSNTTGAVVLLGGLWSRTGSLLAMRATSELRGIVGDIEAEVGIEVANVENDPLAFISISGYKNTAGVHYPTGWVSVESGVAGRQIWRPAWRVKNTSTSNLTLVRAYSVLEWIMKS